MQPREGFLLPSPRMGAMGLSRGGRVPAHPAWATEDAAAAPSPARISTLPKPQSAACSSFGLKSGRRDADESARGHQRLSSFLLLINEQ